MLPTEHFWALIESRAFTVLGRRPDVSQSSSGGSKLPCTYLSRPAIVTPDAALDNDMVLSQVRASFRGSASEWDPIEQGIRYVFERCNTQVRYVDPDPTLSPGEFASRAATACLWQNGVYASEVDLLVMGELPARRSSRRPRPRWRGGWARRHCR